MTETKKPAIQLGGVWVPLERISLIRKERDKTTITVPLTGRQPDPHWDNKVAHTYVLTDGKKQLFDDYLQKSTLPSYMAVFHKVIVNLRYVGRVIKDSTHIDVILVGSAHELMGLRVRLVGFEAGQMIDRLKLYYDTTIVY